MADRNEFDRQRNAGAYAGWGDTEAWADFNATGGQQVGGNKNFDISPFMQPFDFSKQADESANFRDRFKTWLGGLETPQQTRDKYSNMYGYEGDKQKYQANTEALGDVTAQIKAIPGNVESRGSQTIMTQAQKANVATQEVGKLMETYNNLSQIDEGLGRRLALTESNLNDASQLEMARQQQQMTPWLQEYQDINVKQAREFSGWTFASQLELDRLMANQRAGIEWSDAEANRAHELAMQENAFANSVSMLEKTNELSFDLWGKTDGALGGTNA